MKQIEEYVNSIYRDIDGNKEEIEEFKQEMRSHLLEAVQNLKASGKTEEEAVQIAIQNFGGKQQIREGLSEFFNIQKRFARYVLGFALISLVLGIFFLSNAFLEAKEYKEALKRVGGMNNGSSLLENSIMDDISRVLEGSSEISAQEEGQLIQVLEKYQEKLNLIAVFPARDLKDWLKENEFVKKHPTTIFPIEYQKAAIVIGNQGVIKDKESIVPSDYDLGTVVKANKQWVIQYEYKDSYESTVEEHHQLTYYGPSNWDFYKVPTMFFVIFGVLGIVWLFLKRHNRQVKKIMD
jgi:hypothetical protein